ncbi:MAG: hypothetical protein CVV27_09215 [Candidatus Melainabacteria bacterium HGW-Melainabacteria-1]|nr:MAG: hypothetical protein CVV27_09215 [Candidatus Melainabacteria bacterium HGW-Melainabacteria-1]
MRAAVQVSFGDVSPEDRKMTQLRARVADQYRQRFGVELGDDVKAVLNNMSEPAELEQALRVMATQKRSDLPAPDLNAFEQALQSVHQDFFTPISDEIHQRQQQ